MSNRSAHRAKPFMPNCQLDEIRHCKFHLSTSCVSSMQQLIGIELTAASALPAEIALVDRASVS